MDDKSLAAFAIFQRLKQCFNVSQTFPKCKLTKQVYSSMQSKFTLLTFNILFSQGFYYNTSISSNDKPVLLAIIS